MKYLVKILQAALILTLIITLLPVAGALKPTAILDAPSVSPGYPGPGTVSGRVTTPASQGVPGAYVAIVNAADPTQAFYAGTADENGFYTFPAVNNTMAGDSPRRSYKVYASLSSAGESLTEPFGVGEGSTVQVNVTIATKPAKIVLTSERDSVVANGDDHVVISAYVTDALGQPVEDGTAIDFWLNESQWTVYSEKGNGTLNTGSNFAPCFKILNVTTKAGRANVTFGWANYAYAGCSKEIKAYYAPDYSISASTTVYFKPVLDGFYGEDALYGVVQDIRGKPFGSAAITLHWMGRLPNGSMAEIYTAKTTSSGDTPYPGSYVFKDIPWNGNFTYGYLTAVAEVTEGTAFAGCSNNFTRPYGWSYINLYLAMPDAIKLSAQPDTMTAGGSVSAITAQLYLNGKPYKMAGVGVTFSSSGDTAGYLPATKAIVTDKDGRATINLTSGQTAGDVKVAGYSRIDIAKNITGEIVVHIVGQSSNSSGVGEKNDTSTPKAAEGLVNGSTGRGWPDNSSANPGPITPAATPVPEKSAAASGTEGLPVIYAVLAIVTLAVAGLAVYIVAFRKK